MNNDFGDFLLDDNSTDSKPQTQKEARSLTYFDQLKDIMERRDQRYAMVFNRDRLYKKAQQDYFIQNVVIPIEQQVKAMAKWRQLAQESAQAFQKHISQSKGRYGNQMQPFQDAPQRFQLYYSGTDRFKRPTSAKLQHDDDVEILVPIRLDMTLQTQGGYSCTLKDCFTWNLGEKSLTPFAFSEILCYDFDIQPSVYAEQIATQIAVQLEDFKQFSQVYDKLDRAAVYARLSDNDINNLQQGHSRRDLEDAQKVVQSIKFDQPGELKCKIYVNVVIANVQVMDMFELDLYSAKPELIAQKLSVELGLGGEFLTAITHQIREQCWLYIKALQCIGYQFDGSPVLDEEVAEWFQHVDGLYHEDNREDWTPQLNFLTEQDMQSLVRDKDVKSSRKRRNVRARRPGVTAKDVQNLPVDQFGFQVGVQDNGYLIATLPDMTDPPKTVRTLKYAVSPLGDQPVEWLSKYSLISDEVKQERLTSKPTYGKKTKRQSSVVPRRSTLSRAASQAAQQNIKQQTEAPSSSYEEYSSGSDESDYE